MVKLQQKIRRDREKREERRMGGKQQLAKGRLRERWVFTLKCVTNILLHVYTILCCQGSLEAATAEENEEVYATRSLRQNTGMFLLSTLT